MFTLSGWSEEVAADTTSEKLTAIPDEHIKTEGDNIIVPELNKLIGIYGIGLTGQNAQITSPSLRRTALLDVAPIEVGASPAWPPDPILQNENYTELDVDEHVSAYMGNSDGAVARQQSVFAWLADDQAKPISGRVYTVKATSAGTVVAYAWGSCSLVMSQELPVGVYQLVGARMQSAAGIVFRFVFVGGIWRPGMVCVAGLTDKDPDKARYGGLGVWGTFAHNKLPTIELLSSSTAGAGTLYLDLIKSS